MPRIIAVVTENAPTLSYPMDGYLPLPEFNLHRIQYGYPLPSRPIQYCA